MGKRTHFMWMVIGVLALLLLTSCASVPPANDPADIAAIDKIWATYAAAVTTGDVAAMDGLWAEDAIKMAPNAPVIKGKANIMARVQKNFTTNINTMSIRMDETVVVGDLAYSRGSYDQTTKPSAGGPTTKLAGKFLDILERQADGSWKITRDCFNYDAAPVQIAE